MSKSDLNPIGLSFLYRLLLFLQGSGGADSGLGSDEPAQAERIATVTDQTGDQQQQPQVVMRRTKKSAINQRPKSEYYPRQMGGGTDLLDGGGGRAVLPSASVSNLKPSESVRRSKRYSAFGVNFYFNHLLINI